MTRTYAKGLGFFQIPFFLFTLLTSLAVYGQDTNPGGTSVSSADNNQATSINLSLAEFVALNNASGEAGLVDQSVVGATAVSTDPEIIHSTEIVATGVQTKESQSGLKLLKPGQDMAGSGRTHAGAAIIIPTQKNLAEGEKVDSEESTVEPGQSQTLSEFFDRIIENQDPSAANSAVDDVNEKEELKGVGKGKKKEGNIRSSENLSTSEKQPFSDKTSQAVNFDNHENRADPLDGDKQAFDQQAMSSYTTALWRSSKGDSESSRQSQLDQNSGVDEEGIYSKNTMLTTMKEELSSPLDIYAVVHRAIAFHPDIAESLGKLYEQKEIVNEARSGYFPQISSGMSSGYRTTSGRSDESFNFNVSQLLYDFGKVDSVVDSAQYGIVRDRAAVLMAVDDLARDTARAFIEVQRYQELVEISDRFVVAIRDLQDLAGKRSAKGASSRSDEIQARSRKHSAEATASQYRSKLNVWTTTLQNLIGTNSDLDLTGGFPTELSNFCQWVPEKFDNVPRLVIAEAEQAIAKQKIKTAKAEFMPTLSLNAGYDHFFNPANDNGLVDDEYFTLTLDLKSKLYEGGAISARRRSAEYALNRAIAARKSALLDVERALRESKVQSKLLSEKIRFLDARYDDIVKTQELYRQQYLSLGTRTLLDILNTEAEIFQSLFDIKNDSYEIQRLQVDCLHSVAGLRDAFAVNESLFQGVSINP